MSTIDTTVSSLLEEYGYSDTTTSTASTDLDKDAFLSLLITEMEYQDPLEPTSNTEYISQLATFSSLEQMQSLNTTMELSQANDMIGKVVYAQVLDSTGTSYTEVYGLVDAVSIYDSTVYLSVDGEDVAMDDVTMVSYLDYDSETVLSLEEIYDSLEKVEAQLEEITGIDGDTLVEDDTNDTTDDDSDN